MPEIFSHRFKVPASAIDAREHVNNLTYLEWCLDAAEKHWISKANEDIRSKYIWYVLKHTINYKAPSFLGEELEIETWVTSAKGVKSERNYRIFRVKDDKTLIEAQTEWCLLDSKTQRPIRITDEIRTLFA